MPARFRYGTGHVQFANIELRNSAGEPCRVFRFGEEVTLEASLDSKIDTKNLSAIPPLKKGGRVTVRFAFKNVLRVGSYGISLAVNRVSRRDYTDSILFDQIDGCIAFAVVPDPDRPVHYKFHHPVMVTCEV